MGDSATSKTCLVTLFLLFANMLVAFPCFEQEVPRLPGNLRTSHPLRRAIVRRQTVTELCVQLEDGRQLFLLSSCWCGLIFRQLVVFCYHSSNVLDLTLCLDTWLNI